MSLRRFDCAPRSEPELHLVRGQIDHSPTPLIARSTLAMFPA